MKAKTIKTALLAAAGVTGASLAAPATAQIDEITVTAQFREESLSDVPAAVTAFTERDIKSAGIRSTEDFVNLTPNMSFDDSFTYLNSFVVVRGVTQINNADSPVAIIVDGVPQNNQKQFKMPLFDVQQIEVLKGPQGALYGRNAIGGAINIVTKQPTNEFEGFLGGGVMNGMGYRAEAGLSGPIVPDRVLFRVAGSFFKTDGLIENEYLGKDADFVDHDYSIRGKVNIVASDRFRFDLRAAYTDFRAGSSYDSIVSSLLNPSFRSGTARDYYDPTTSFEGFTEGDIFELTGKADLNLGFATATYIVGRTRLNEDYRADLDFSNPTQPSFGPFGELGQGQNLDVTMFSQELRLVSPDAQRLRWILGAYHISTDRDLLTRGFLDLDSAPEQFDTGIVIIERNESNDNSAWAVFGQAELDLTEALTVQLGGRYDRDNRNQVLPGSPGSDRSLSFDSFQPKATLRYKLSPDVTTYFTYATGFRSGGFNAPGVVLDSFEDETLTNYELGFKTRLLGGTVALNAAAFHSKSENFQFFFVDASTVSQIISNLADVSIWGFDADFALRPVEGFTLYGGVGLTDSEIKSIGNAALESYLAASGVDLSLVEGAHTPKTTKWSFNLGAQLEREIGAGLNGVLRADFEHRGDKYWQIDNIDVQEPVNLLSLRASIESERWTLSVWARNLLDERYYADFNPSEYAGAPFDLGFLAQPRTYGADIRVRF